MQSLYVHTPRTFVLFFSCNIHMHIDIHTCRHTNIYAYTCNMHLHACMHAVTQTFMPIHALCTCMHADTPLYLFRQHTHAMLCT